MGELAVFIILSAVILIPGVIVVTSGSIVRSPLSLVPTFFGVTGFYIMLQAEFVAGIQVLIYAGAITALILFVIMLTEGGSAGGGAGGWPPGGRGGRGGPPASQWGGPPWCFPSSPAARGLCPRPARRRI